MEFTEADLNQRIQENRRDLKRRIESLRTVLWTVLEALEGHQPMDLSRADAIVQSARAIQIITNQIGLEEQRRIQLIRARLQARSKAAYNEFQADRQRELSEGVLK